MSGMGSVKGGWTRRGRGLLALLMLLLLPALAACEIADAPDGWAAPTADPQERDTVLLATGEGRVVAVNLPTSNADWQFPGENKTFIGIDGELEPTAFYANPVWSAFTDEWLVAEYQSGVVYGIQPQGRSARVVFNAAALFNDARIVADPLLDPLHPDRLYVVTTDYRAHAVNIENPPASVEDLIWSWGGGSEHPVWGAPALVDGLDGRLLVLAGLDGRITALRLDGPEAGEAAWSRRLGAGVASALLGHEGTLYFGAFDRTFYALDPRAGDIIWTAQGANWFWSTPMIADDVVYAADLDGNLYAWDAATGTARWDTPYAAGERIRTRPIVIGGDAGATVVLVSRDGVIHQVDAATGLGLWRSADLVDDDVLADALYRDGQLYISNESGRLFSVALGINAATQVYPRQDS